MKKDRFIVNLIIPVGKVLLATMLEIRKFKFVKKQERVTGHAPRKRNYKVIVNTNIAI